MRVFTYVDSEKFRHEFLKSNRFLDEIEVYSNFYERSSLLEFRVGTNELYENIQLPFIEKVYLGYVSKEDFFSKVDNLVSGIKPGYLILILTTDSYLKLRERLNFNKVRVVVFFIDGYDSFKEKVKTVGDKNKIGLSFYSAWIEEMILSEINFCTWADKVAFSQCKPCIRRIISNSELRLVDNSLVNSSKDQQLDLKSHYLSKSLFDKRPDNIVDIFENGFNDKEPDEQRNFTVWKNLQKLIENYEV